MSMTPPEVDKLDSIEQSLRKLSRNQLLELADEVSTLEARLALTGPQTDDELHQWIKDHIGIDIPRVSVCPNHDPPFKFFADCYFSRTNSALLMANRGGSKTFLVALLHLVNSKFKPGCESATVGAIEAQAKRCYAHLLRLIEKSEDFKSDLARDPLQSETRWKNQSRVEILPGTMAAVNGPHPNVVHADEVELMDPEVYDESRNMSMSSNGIRAQDIVTSTRKRGVGMMQTLVDQVAEAKQNNLRAPYDLYQWCVWETAAPQKNCRMANPDGENLCECDKVVRGRWDNGDVRRFSDVCGGKLAKSQGWMPLDDLHKTFMLDSQEVWEAQIECMKPSTEGMVLPRFDPDKHGIQRYIPDPDNGPIFEGIDFGGTNPHAVIFLQLLRYDVNAKNAVGETIRIREGSIVAFDEFYRSEIGNGELARFIVAYENRYKKRFETFNVKRRFADPQGKAARLDLAHYNPPLKTSFFVTRDVKEHIKAWRALIDDNMYFVDVTRCKMHLEEIAAWHYPRKKAGLVDDPDIPVNDFDHTLAAARYALTNILFMEKRMLRKGGVPSSEQVRQMRGTESDIGVRPYGNGPASGPRQYVGSEHPRDWRTSIRP